MNNLIEPLILIVVAITTLLIGLLMLFDGLHNFKYFRKKMGRTMFEFKNGKWWTFGGTDSVFFGTKLVTKNPTTSQRILLASRMVTDFVGGLILIIVSFIGIIINILEIVKNDK